MSETVTLFTAEPVQLLFVVTDPDEREPDKYVLSTFLNIDGIGRDESRRIARQTTTLEEAATTACLASEPRFLLYVGWEEDPGIQAQLFALTPDESEAWKGASGMEGHYLGTVVRATEFRVAPNSLYDEGVDHFSAILGGRTTEPIEQMMKRLA